MEKTNASGNSPVRTIKEIQDSITTEMQNNGLKLSSSPVAEWRLWNYIIAVAIHSFEVILDLFRKEVGTLINKITPGTVRWYAEMCYRFQNGHELLFDNKSAMLYYEKDAPNDRLIKVVAITEAPNRLSIKAAKIDNAGKIVPLTSEEKHNFIGYIDAIKFAGVQTDVVSTTEDKIKYDLEVFFEPAIPTSTVRSNIKEALEKFKTALGFDSMFYTQKFIDTVMSVDGVITCNLKTISRKGSSDLAFIPFTIFTELESGYFEYVSDSEPTLISIKDIRE